LKVLRIALFELSSRKYKLLFLIFLGISFAFQGLEWSFLLEDATKIIPKTKLKLVFQNFEYLGSIILGINILLMQSFKSKNTKKLISDGLMPIEYYLKDLSKVIIAILVTLFATSLFNFLVYTFAAPKDTPFSEVLFWIFGAWEHMGHVYLFRTVFMVFCVYLLPNYGSVILYIGIQMLEVLLGTYSSKIFPGLNLDGSLPFTELMKYEKYNSVVQVVPMILISILFLTFIWASLKLIETKGQ